MKIAYPSAYIQIQTFNFTFAQQAFIVYFNCAKQVRSWQRSVVAMVTTLPHVKFSCIHCCYRRPVPEM